MMVFQQLPTLKFLHRFGCAAYPTLPKRVGKFTDRSVRKFFVGLTSNSALLLDVATGSINPASNVFYTESQVYGHLYGPFENTKFRDPLRLKRAPSRRSAVHFQDDNVKPPYKRACYKNPLSLDDEDTSVLEDYLATTFETAEV